MDIAVGSHLFSHAGIAMNLSSPKHLTKTKTAIWLVVLVGLLTTLLVTVFTAGGVPEVSAQGPVVTVNVGNGNALPIASLDLTVNGTSTTIAGGNTCNGVSNPGPEAIIDAVTLADGRVLDFINIASTITNYNDDPGNGTGPATPGNVNAWVNGTPVPWDDPNFATALSNSYGNPNLQDHISYDGGGTAMGEVVGDYADFDVIFQAPYGTGDFVTVAERNGNTFFNLIPLGIDGNPIPGASTVMFDAAYSINTCIVPPGAFTTQPWWLSVADVSLFNIDTDVTPIYGFRVDNEGNADFKFVGLSTEPFIPVVPVLEVRKTIVPGPNGTCPASFAASAAGPDTIPVVAGDTVTYCFWVANTGDGPATDVQVTDAALGFTSLVEPFVGATGFWNAGSIDEVIDANTPNPNTATVTGTDPADPANDLTATDDAGIVPGVPVLEIRKTVVAAGTPCPATFLGRQHGRWSRE